MDYPVVTVKGRFGTVKREDVVLGQNSSKKKSVILALARTHLYFEGKTDPSIM